MLQDRSSPVESLRQRNVAERRQRILDAARRLILKKGVSALSMRKLAQESGLAVKTLYNLWGGRDAILRALVDEAMDRMDQALEAEAPLEDPLERCRAVVTVSVRHLVEDEAISRAEATMRTDLTDEDGLTLPITASFAISGFPWGGDTVDAIIDDAVASMSRGKPHDTGEVPAVFRRSLESFDDPLDEESAGP